MTMQKTITYFKKYTTKISLDFNYFSVDDFEANTKNIKNIIDYLELLEKDFSAEQIDLYYLSGFYDNDYFNLSRFLWYTVTEFETFQIEIFKELMQ